MGVLESLTKIRCMTTFPKQMGQSLVCSAAAVDTDKLFEHVPSQT